MTSNQQRSNRSGWQRTRDALKEAQDFTRDYGTHPDAYLNKNQDQQAWDELLNDIK